MNMFDLKPISAIDSAGHKTMVCRSRLIACVVLTGAMMLLSAQVGYGQWIEEDEIVSPLVNGDPFDLVTLNEGGDNALLKIVPQSNPPRQPLDKRGVLIFEYAQDAEDTLQVPFSSIENYQTFNDLLIEEANQWLRSKEYSKAFQNLLYVYDHGGKKDPKLVQSLRSCRFLDAKENFQGKRYELALSIFEDIYRREPDFQFPGIDSSLIEIIMLCYDGIIEKQFDDLEYAQVHRTLTAVVEEYGDDTDDLREKWEQAFVHKADELLETARRHATAGQGRMAHMAARHSEQMAPGRDVIKQLREDLLRQYPLIMVGVSQASGDSNPKRIAHWGARRVGRLTQRSIVELIGLSDEGGKYKFLNGELSRDDEAGLKYVLELKPEMSAEGTPPANAFEIASRLLAAANPDREEFDVAWAKVVKTVSIENQHRVVIQLRTPFIRPEALLDIAYVDSSQEDSEKQTGFYVKTGEVDDISTFELNPRIEVAAGRRHPVIVEQLFADDSQASDELIKGNIDAVDRIPINDLKRLKSTSGIIVRPYGLPTVHMLIPKIRGEGLEKNIDFRSGLSHAIDREKIILGVIGNGQEISGNDVISGPFPIGSMDNDQIAYGYDFKVRPYSFDPILAAVLINLSIQPTAKRPEKIVIPTLVIAYPQSSAARLGAESIARMWSEIGIETMTRALEPNQSTPPDDLWDFLYLEATIEEPLTNASDLVGPTGFVKQISAPAEQTLRQITYAVSWREACNSMRRLHRQLAVDLSIIPLWQTQEHYAYRNTVRGVGRDLIHFYQHVDRWQIETYASDEQE